MTFDGTEILLGLMTIFSGGLVAWIASAGSRREARIEAKTAEAKIAADERAAKEAAALAHEASLIEQLQEEVGSLRASRQEDQITIRQLFTEFNEMKALQIEANIGIKILINQIIDAGETPLWIPQPPI
jgi:hypothetical protein